MKRNITIAIAALLSFAYVISGCNKMAKEEQIVQHYYVNYNNGVVFANANFVTAGNKSRPVVFESRRVKANGITSNSGMMDLPSGYSWSLDSASDVTFTLELNDKTLTNTVSKSAMGSSELVADSVYSLQDTISISWTGNPVQSGESVYVSINRNYDSTSSTYFGSTTGWFNGEGYIFDILETKNFPAGTYTITLNRHKNMPLQQSDNGAGGDISVSMYTTKTVVLR
jgi:hypothetical protein